MNIKSIENALREFNQDEKVEVEITFSDGSTEICKIKSVEKNLIKAESKKGKINISKLKQTLANSLNEIESAIK